MIMKHLDLKWHKIIKLEKNKSMKVVFNYIVFLWLCSYLSLSELDDQCDLIGWWKGSVSAGQHSVVL